jgi:hypothetical protein
MTARDAMLILAVGALAAARLPGVPPAPRAARDSGETARPGPPLVLQARTYRVHADRQGFRFRIERPDARVVAPAHAISGLQIVGPMGAVEMSSRSPMRRCRARSSTQSCVPPMVWTPA